MGDLEPARLYLIDAIDHGPKDDALFTAIVMSWYGWVIIEQGRVDDAVAVWEQAHKEVGAALHQTGRAYLASKLGIGADEKGEHERAAQYHYEAREVFVKAGDLGGEGYTLSRLSWTHHLLGEDDKAVEYGHAGLERFEQLNHRWGVAASWCRIGFAELGRGDIAEASRAFGMGLEKALDSDMKIVAYYALIGFGMLLVDQGREHDGAVLLAFNQGIENNPYESMATEALESLGSAGRDTVHRATAEAASLTFDDAVVRARRSADHLSAN